MRAVARESMEGEDAPGRPSWAGLASSWVLRWARGAARPAAAACLSSRRSAFRLPERGSRTAALLQEPGGGPSKEEAAAPAEEASHQSNISEEAVGSSSKANSCEAPETLKLHFCDDTNEPEDVCNAQWLVLWSYAAYAPERPSEAEQHLLRAFFEFFPDQCTYGPAANCYSEAVRASPPRVNDRRELLLWLCMLENQCRAKAGMPLKRCRHSDLMKRWRYADGYM
ncbi:hypothetical protein Efla_001863 [Eimeria flavescens]